VFRFEDYHEYSYSENFRPQQNILNLSIYLNKTDLKKRSLINQHNAIVKIKQCKFMCQNELYNLA
jgi:hypothetical protein